MVNRGRLASTYSPSTAWASVIVPACGAFSGIWTACQGDAPAGPLAASGPSSMAATVERVCS